MWNRYRCCFVKIYKSRKFHTHIDHLYIMANCIAFQYPLHGRLINIDNFRSTYPFPLLYNFWWQTIWPTIIFDIAYFENMLETLLHFHIFDTMNESVENFASNVFRHVTYDPFRFAYARAMFMRVCMWVCVCVFKCVKKWGRQMANYCGIYRCAVVCMHSLAKLKCFNIVWLKYLKNR